MFTIDELCAMPGAGSALLSAHRWAQQANTQPHASAFDVLGMVGRTQRTHSACAESLAAIARADATAHAMLGLLWSMYAIERAQALAGALGVDLFALPSVARALDEFQRLRRSDEAPGATL